MRRWVIEVFNDVVYGTTAVYTPTRLNEVLAQVDQLSVQAIADQSGGTSPTLAVVLEHSNDQRNWLTKTTLISATSIPAASTTPLFGADPGTTPTGGFARLAITVGGSSNPNAHIKIMVCGRDGAG